MKKIISVISALFLICTMMLTAFAVSSDGASIVTYGSKVVFTDEETALLETQLQDFSEMYDMGLFLVFKSDDPSATGESYADYFINENSLGLNGDGGLITVEDLDNGTFDCYPYGFCVDIFTESVSNEIFNSRAIYYDKAVDKYDYYEMYLSVISDVSYFYTAKRPDKLGEYAPNYDFGAPDSGGALLADWCDLFTDEQETALVGMLQDFKAKHNCDLILHTTDTLSGKSVVDYADDYYDYNNYAEDGLLFMVCMAGGEGNRDYYTSTKGYAITALTDYARGKIEDEVVPLLVSGDYYDAFAKYVEMADIMFVQAETGNPYDYGNAYKTTEDIITAEFIAAIVAAVIAFVVLRVMKSKMNTARAKTNAREYVVPDSLNITDGQDVFTHSTVSKTAIPKSTSSSSGGGGSHSSSSGSSHGGGGGKF